MNQKAKEWVMRMMDRLRIQKRKWLGTRQPSIRGATQMIPVESDRIFDFRKRSKRQRSITPTSEVPLFLQSNPKWAHLPYGTDGQKTIGENGCAIVALAMVGTHFGLSCSPKEVLEWAQNDYYMYVSGTSWNIFGDFAKAYRLECEDLENNLSRAKRALSEGKLVVASLKEGHFTDEGHIVVLTGYQDGGFSMNDPNDTADKLHHYRWMDEQFVAEDSLHFWAYAPL